jgi:regulator of protease activity HflC (stomatin/prohibitin superfamily)
MAKYEDDSASFNLGKKIAVFAIVILVILVVAGSAIKVVNAGHRGVLLTFGKVEPNILGEGLTFVVPFQQDVVVMSVQTQLYSADASAASKDMQDVSTKIAVNYHIDATRVAEIYQKFTVNYQGNIIQPAVQESTKAVTAEFTAEELITKRPDVKEKIESALKERLMPYGIIVETISITDFQFSPSFTTAIEAKVVATQNALKAENDLRRITVEAQQQVAQAAGQANATLTKAIAEAEAIKITALALKENPQLIQLEAIKKWDGVLPVNMYGSAPVPFINIQANTVP